MDVPRRRGHWVEKEATLIDPAVGSIPGVDRGRSGFGRIDSLDIFGRRKNNQLEIVLKIAFKEAFPNRFPLENLRNPFRQLVPHRFPAFPSRNTVRNILKVEKVSPNQNLSKIPNFCLQFRLEFRPATSKKSVPWLFLKKPSSKRAKST